MNSQVIVLTSHSGTDKSTLTDQLAGDLGVPPSPATGYSALGEFAPAHHVLAKLGRPDYLAMSNMAFSNR